MQFPLLDLTATVAYLSGTPRSEGVQLSTQLHGMNAAARRAYLIEIRKQLEMIQENMAAHLDMSLRAYSDLENGKSECRVIHILAAERVALYKGRLHVDPSLLPDYVLDDVLSVAAVKFGDRLIPAEAFGKLRLKK